MLQLYQKKKGVFKIKTDILNLRIDPALKEELKAAAEADGRTLSNYIMNILTNKLKEEKNMNNQQSELKIEVKQMLNDIRNELYFFGDDPFYREGEKSERLNSLLMNIIPDMLAYYKLPGIDLPDIADIPCYLDYEVLSDDEREAYERKAADMKDWHTGLDIWNEETGAKDQYYALLDKAVAAIDQYIAQNL